MSVLSIIVVDDDVNFLSTLSDILRSHNWSVDVADSGIKAIEMVKQKHYDIAFLDVNMPGIDGIETFSQIKKIRPDMVTFMITGETLEKVQGLVGKGVSSIMQKPVDVNKIIDTVSQLEKGKKDEVILIVDDNEDDRNMLSDILTKKGFRVMAAKTGFEAIEHVRSDKFDVILLDIKLPDMDGITVLEKIKEIKPSSGIIAITGYSLDGVIENIINKGAYTCFLKPFDVEMLLNDVNYIIKSNAKREIEGQKPADAPLILIVEDNEDIRVSMLEVLESEGYNAKTAGSVPEAEKMIEEYVFDLVLSDLSLGNQSGLALVESVRKRNRFACFILMTGYGSMETALEAIKKDVDEYILKPVRPHDLVNKVKTYIEKSRLNREKNELVKRLQESNVKLMELSNTDELTEVNNRRYFFDQLHIEMQRAVRQKSYMSLLMCDVDGFKTFNDTYGHMEGDKLLKEIARLLKFSLRKYVDQIFRYGGDEFAIIVPGLKKENAFNLAERIVSKITGALESKKIGISIGISVLSSENKDISLNTLIELADKKLYEAKKLGGRKAVI
jgi:diguanylate cyclase (GGDEF)-like protein